MRTDQDKAVEFGIEIKNYRCFTDVKPARVRIRPGFTALIGPNNAGKSAFLKALFDVRRTMGAMSKINGLGSALQRKGSFGIRRFLVEESADRGFTRLNDRRFSFTVRPDRMRREGAVPVADELVVTFPRESDAAISTTIRAAGEEIWADTEVWGPGEDGVLWAADDRKLVDVALLRSAAGDLSRCMYIGAFRNALSLKPSGRYHGIQVGTGFIQSWHHLKNNPDPEGNANAYRVTDDIRRLFRLKNVDINASSDGTTMVVYLDGVAHTLDELGSGLAQFIVTLANAAMQRPSYLLVDEPELNLHPSLQVDFLTTLGSYASRGVIFATHSIGLARSVADTIYSVRLGPGGVSEVREFEDTPSLPELLGEMSFAGYRDLGFKTVLLVEGATDIKTMQQFLRQRGKDHEIVVLQLGGSSMINADREHELAEVRRIAERVVALIDSERETERAPLASAREGFRRICARLGIDCQVLERRALENYLSDRAVKLVKGEKYRGLRPYERLTDVDPAWAKPESWRIAREMRASEIKGTDLHKILSSL